MDRVSAGASLLFPAGPVLMEFATMVGGRGEIKKDVDFPEAGEDTALCDKENKPPRIAQGSSNVFINNQPAARQGDNWSAAQQSWEVRRTSLLAVSR